MVEACPLCGSELSRVKYSEIREKLRESEEKAAAAAKLEAQKIVLQERKKLAVERDQFEAKIRAEKDALKRKNEEQAQALASAKIENGAQKRRTKEQVEAAVAATRKKIETEADKKAAAQLDKDRSALEAAFQQQRLRETRGWQNERLKLLAKTQELERKLQAKTAHELGDGAEVDILEALKGAWDEEGDSIRRIKKGEDGADILHEVRFEGDVCGRILIESKNRQKWLNGDTSKLRDDMREVSADYGVLAATKFPSAKREMFMQDDVLVVRPIEVLEIVRVLRSALIRMHSLRLSNTERAEKTAQLYEYINSKKFRDALSEIRRLAQTCLDQELVERKQHDKWWQERAQASRVTQKVIGNVEAEMNAIIRGKTDD